MKLTAAAGRITHSRGAIPVDYDVLDAREIGNIIVVVFDYMAFPRGSPARNLFAYSGETGALLWRADDIGMGSTDAYTGVLSEVPLKVGNFAGVTCTVDVTSGRISSEDFTK